MFGRNKKLQLTKAHEDEIVRADDQLIKAEKELSIAQELARTLSVIRSENHFSRDFRKALGVENGR